MDRRSFVLGLAVLSGCSISNDQPEDSGEEVRLSAPFIRIEFQWRRSGRITDLRMFLQSENRDSRELVTEVPENSDLVHDVQPGEEEILISNQELPVGRYTFRLRDDSAAAPSHREIHKTSVLISKKTLK